MSATGTDFNAYRVSALRQAVEDADEAIRDLRKLRSAGEHVREAEKALGRALNAEEAAALSLDVDRAINAMAAVADHLRVHLAELDRTLAGRSS